MRQIEIEQDLSTINHWMKGHDKRGFVAEELPTIGFIVDGVAAAFLYQTDSSVGILENFVSNPEATPKQVAKALDLIIAELKRAASREGIAQLLVFSKVRSIGKRISRLGFELKGDWQGYSTQVKARVW